MMARPLTVSEVAERWQCCEQTVYRVIETGALRSFGVGRLLRIRPEWVDAYECGETTDDSDGSEALRRIRARRLKSAGRSGTSPHTRTRPTHDTGTGSGQDTR